MPFVAMVHWRAKPERVAAVRERLSAIDASTRAFPGCRSYLAFEVEATDGRFILVSEWVSPEAYAAYMAWRRDSGVLAAFAADLAEAPELSTGRRIEPPRA